MTQAELQAQITKLEQDKLKADSATQRKIRKQLRKLRDQLLPTLPEEPQPPAEPATKEKRPRTRRLPAAPVQKGLPPIPADLKKIDWNLGVTAYCIRGTEPEIGLMCQKFEKRWGYPPEWYADFPQGHGFAFGPVPTTPWYEGAQDE